LQDIPPVSPGTFTAGARIYPLLSQDTGINIASTAFIRVLPALTITLHAAAREKSTIGICWNRTGSDAIPNAIATINFVRTILVAHTGRPFFLGQTFSKVTN
jgi:hypothetical protein